MRRLVLRSFQSPGDILILTAAVRDLHAAWPGQFQTDVRTSADAIWENNPLITPLNENEPGVQTLDMHYPLIHQSNQRPYHFIHGYTQYLEHQLGITIPVTKFHGDLNALKDAVGDLQFAQDWALDATGNWRDFREDDDGDATWDLNQQRTSNKVNEISGVSETVGPSWVTPVYNRAGNMTTIPKPADPTAFFSAIYDAWNRLVRIEEGSDKVAELEYDGAKRRTVKKTYASGTLEETRHFYYTEPAKWQVVEERVNTSSNPGRQFVWGLRYVDDIVLCDRDTTGNGTLDERLYGMQDANWNVTTIANAAGSIEERFAYSPYGISAVFDATFGSRATSNYHWEVRFAGYRFDDIIGCYQVRN